VSSSTKAEMKMFSPVPRLLVEAPEAAAALGMGVDLFNERVRPTIPCVRLGRKVLFAISTLQLWIEGHESTVF
jgi:hypothetical protein